MLVSHFAARGRASLLAPSLMLSFPFSFVDRMARLFYWHGKFCASHPWEVMVTFLSLAICMFTMGPYVLFDQSHGVASNAPVAPPPPMHFSHMDTSPHLSPDPYKNAANFVSDDIISQNRYYPSMYGRVDQRVQQRSCVQSADCPKKVPYKALTLSGGSLNATSL